MSERLWIWVPKWEDFQHYKPERDRPPAWIKSYTRQLDDDRFLDCSLAARGLLESVRIAFARSSGRLPSDTRGLSRRIGAKVTNAQIAALCDAGLLEVVSRPTLELRLEAFYASRARARVHQGEEETEVEGEEDQEPMRASERELQDAHRSPAEDEHAEDLDSEPELDAEPSLADGPMAEDIRRTLGHLRPRGATA